MKMKINLYMITIMLLSVVFPLVLAAGEMLFFHGPYNISLLAKWFLFSAVGLRLFLAGLKQLLHPQFTLHLFKIDNAKSTVLVQEIGLHNLILGMTALVVPSSYIIAIMSALYFGAAGVLHLLKKGRSMNQNIALISDLYIACMIIILIVSSE